MAGKFEPKQAVTLNPPKDDPISVEELAQANGTGSAAPRRFLQLPGVQQEYAVESS